MFGRYEKVRIIAKSTLTKYMLRRPEVASSIKAWHDEALKAKWTSPAALKRQFRKASILSDKRVVFDIHGNSHRLIVNIEYAFQTVYVIWTERTRNMTRSMQRQSVTLRPIRNKKQYDAALKRAYELMQLQLKPSTPQGDEFEVLTLLIENYESKRFPIPPPHPIEAIEFRLDQLGMEVSELTSILGYRSRVSEVMRGKRKLTLEMIRALHEKLDIPLESLVARY